MGADQGYLKMPMGISTVCKGAYKKQAMFEHSEKWIKHELGILQKEMEKWITIKSIDSDIIKQQGNSNEI